VDDAFTLVGEKPKETAEVHRFEVKVPAGQTKTLTVAEERELRADYTVGTTEDEQIRFLISQSLAGEKVKAGLKRGLELRLAKSRTAVELAELRRQLASILEDQTRMRLNVKELPTNSEIHKRLLEKFEETQIAKYRPHQ
jgi:hypothetical protein